MNNLKYVFTGKVALRVSSNAAIGNQCSKICTIKRHTKLWESKSHAILQPKSKRTKNFEENQYSEWAFDDTNALIIWEKNGEGGAQDFKMAGPTVIWSTTSPAERNDPVKSTNMRFHTLSKTKGTIYDNTTKNCNRKNSEMLTKRPARLEDFKSSKNPKQCLSYAHMIAHYCEAMTVPQNMETFNDFQHSDLIKTVRRSPFGTLRSVPFKRETNLRGSNSYSSTASMKNIKKIRSRTELRSYADMISNYCNELETCLNKKRSDEFRSEFNALKGRSFHNLTWSSGRRKSPKLSCANKTYHGSEVNKQIDWFKKVEGAIKNIKRVTVPANNNDKQPEEKQSQKQLLQSETWQLKNESKSSKSSNSRNIKDGPGIPSTSTGQNLLQTSINSHANNLSQPIIELRVSPTQDESVISINVDSTSTKLSNRLDSNATGLSITVDTAKKDSVSENTLTVSPPNLAQRDQRARSVHIAISEESVPLKQIEFSVNGKPVSKLKSVVARAEKVNVVSSMEKIEVKIPFTADRTKTALTHVQHHTGNTSTAEPILNLEILAKFGAAKKVTGDTGVWQKNALNNESPSKVGAWAKGTSDKSQANIDNSNPRKSADSRVPSDMIPWWSSEDCFTRIRKKRDDEKIPVAFAKADVQKMKIFSEIKIGETKGNVAEYKTSSVLLNRSLTSPASAPSSEKLAPEKPVSIEQPKNQAQDLLKKDRGAEKWSRNVLFEKEKKTVPLGNQNKANIGAKEGTLKFVYKPFKDEKSSNQINPSKVKTTAEGKPRKNVKLPEQPGKNTSVKSSVIGSHELKQKLKPENATKPLKKVVKGDSQNPPRIGEIENLYRQSKTSSFQDSKTKSSDDQKLSSRHKSATERSAKVKPSKTNKKVASEDEAIPKIPWKKIKPEESITPDKRAIQKLFESMRPIEKRKDGTLIDYGVKVPSRKSAEKHERFRNNISVKRGIKKNTSSKSVDGKPASDQNILRKPSKKNRIKKSAIPRNNSKFEEKFGSFLKEQSKPKTAPQTSTPELRGKRSNSANKIVAKKKIADNRYLNENDEQSTAVSAAKKKASHSAKTRKFPVKRDSLKSASTMPEMRKAKPLREKSKSRMNVGDSSPPRLKRSAEQLPTQRAKNTKRGSTVDGSQQSRNALKNNVAVTGTNTLAGTISSPPPKKSDENIAKNVKEGIPMRRKMADSDGKVRESGNRTNKSIGETSVVENPVKLTGPAGPMRPGSNLRVMSKFHLRSKTQKIPVPEY